MTENRWLRMTVPALALAGLLAGCSGAPPEAAGPAPATAVPAANGTSSAAGTASPSAGGGQLVPLSADVAARLDVAVERVLREASIPGVVVALASPGSVGYQKAFGVADKATGQPMTTGFNHRIGSVTKTFTVTAVLRLVDQGKVGLDDPVGTYVDGVPNGDRITIRQLAEMRSGLFPYTADEDFVTGLENDPERSYTPQELLAYGFKHPVVFEPGAEFQYSNTNTVLLGLVVEKAGGRPLQDFIKQEVTGPAGLGKTFLATDAAFPTPHAHGYTNQTPTGATADATDWNPSWGWSAGAMISDLADQQAWAKELATGTLLSAPTQAQRLVFPPTKVPDVSYGLGIFTNHGWIGHNGSLPGYQTLTVYLPSAQASLVLMINTDITYQGLAPSTLVAKAVTEIVSPGNVYDLPAEQAPDSASPSASSSASPSASASPAARA